MLRPGPCGPEAARRQAPRCDAARLRAPPGGAARARRSRRGASRAAQRGAHLRSRAARALRQIENAHPVGAMAVSWSPAAPPGSLVSAKGPGQPERRFASAGCDNTVKVCLVGAAPCRPYPLRLARNPRALRWGLRRGPEQAGRRGGGVGGARPRARGSACPARGAALPHAWRGAVTPAPATPCPGALGRVSVPH